MLWPSDLLAKGSLELRVCVSHVGHALRAAEKFYDVSFQVDLALRFLESEWLAIGRVLLVVAQKAVAKDGEEARTPRFELSAKLDEIASKKKLIIISVARGSDIVFKRSSHHCLREIRHVEI